MPPNTTTAVLDELYLRYGDYYVFKMDGGQPAYGWKKWRHYSEIDDDTPNQRQILPNEIVIDLDYDQDSHVENIRRNLAFAEQIVERLDQDDITYSMWRSGGKGAHIHVFYKPGCASNIESDGRLQQFKEWFIRRYAPDGLTDLGFVDLDTTGGSTLIQAEHSEHRKGTGTKLKRRGKHLVENDLTTLVEEFYSETRPVQLDPPVQHKKDGGDYSETENTLIEYCLENQVTDCRDRLLYFIISRVEAADGIQAATEIALRVNKMFADPDDDTYMPDNQVEHRVEYVQRRREEEGINPPSYGWMLKQIRNCSDTDLQEFAEEWAETYDVSTAEAGRD